MKTLGIHALLTLCACAFLAAQSLTSVLLPQYIEGLNGTNSNRIPFAYRARITGLTPGAVYRYYNQVVTSADGDSTDGAGNCIFVSSAGDFVRTSNPGFTKIGTYGILTADGTGAFEGWFITEPTGNTRFIPGRSLFMRIMMKDSSAASMPTLRCTTVDSVRVLRLASGISDTTGTGLRGMGGGKPKDFIIVYDNAAGTGRPISGTYIEADGTSNTTGNNYASFYSSRVNDIVGAFGMIVPSRLPGGVKLVEECALQSGMVVATATDEDGIWPSGVNTINPGTGTAELVLTASDVHLATSVGPSERVPFSDFRLGSCYPNPFNPSTTIDVTLGRECPVTIDVVSILGTRVATLVHTVMAAGTHVVHFDAADLPSGMYLCRMSAGSFNTVQKMILAR